MRIAIFHNFLDNIGGAEFVTLTLAREFKADVYTTNIDELKIKKMGFSDVLHRIKSLGKIPINAPLRHQLAFFKFRKLNLGKKYDFYIISGDWAMSGAVNNKPNLWYVHSPLNELWEFKGYIRKNKLPIWQRPLFDLWVSINRKLNLSYLKDVQKLVCNSKNTSNRIKKYYSRDATVINPPVNVKDYHFDKPKNYWLSVNRLFSNKRIDLQIETFKKMKNENLVIVGSYEKSRHFVSYTKYLNRIKSENVKIFSWVDRKKLVDLYANCKGFITTAFNEDFGLAPLEAMASGKPVIACNEGGYKETVINGKTGLLIENITSEKLREAVEKVNFELKKNPFKYRNNCIERAKKYDIKIFIKKIKNEIKNG